MFADLRDAEEFAVDAFCGWGWGFVDGFSVGAEKGGGGRGVLGWRPVCEIDWVQVFARVGGEEERG